MPIAVIIKPITALDFSFWRHHAVDFCFFLCGLLEGFPFSSIPSFSVL